jgi:SHS2 domain-containing protein
MGKNKELRRWEHFHHGADIGVRGCGETRSSAFEQAAIALTAVVTDPAAVERLTSVEVHCSAPDRELLLVDWLNALIYEMATRQMLFSRFKVALDEQMLTGTMWGEKVDIPRHQPAVEVKGATYTELKVERLADDGWLAQCVVDV